MILDAHQLILQILKRVIHYLFLLSKINYYIERIYNFIKINGALDALQAHDLLEDSGALFSILEEAHGPDHFGERPRTYGTLPEPLAVF